MNSSSLFCCDIKNQTKEYICWSNENELFDLIKKCSNDYENTIKQRLIFINKETLFLIIKILRIYLFNKGHFILIANRLLGRQSISQFSAFIQKKNFYEFDELLLEKKTEFVEGLVKKYLAEIIFKKQETVLFFNDRLTGNVYNL